MQLAFAISFFVCRLLIGPVVVYYTWVCPSSPMIVKVIVATHSGCVVTVDCCLAAAHHVKRDACHIQVGGIGIQVVSLFWFYKIAQVWRRLVPVFCKHLVIAVC